MARPLFTHPRRRTSKGAAVVEYAILLSLVGAVVLGTIFITGGNIASLFSTGQTAIANATGQTGGDGGNGGDTGDGGGTPTEELFYMTNGTANTNRVCAHGTHGGSPITYCWGNGANGTLGNGGTSSSSVPVVSALAGVVTDIHTTFTKTCAVVGTTLWCWGDTTMDLNTPTPAPAPYSYVNDVRRNAQSVGPYDCAALTDGSLACVDAGAYDTIDIPSGVFDVATAYLAGQCVLMVDRTVQCKGQNEIGSVGDAFTTIPGLADVDQLVGTSKSFCTLTGSTVACWGYAHDGRLGTGETVDRATPVVVPGAAGAIAIYAESTNDALCAGMPGGGALCWGYLPFGTDGAMIEVATPTAPPNWPGGTPLVGNGFICAALTTGGMRCMGEGADGELGDGTTTTATGEWRDVAFPPAP